MHRFNINGTVYTLTDLQLVAIFAILRLIPINTQGPTYGNETYGNKVRAIKFTREMLKIGLREAKDLVDLLDNRGQWNNDGYVILREEHKTVEYLGYGEESKYAGGGREAAQAAMVAPYGVTPADIQGMPQPAATTSLGQLLRDKLKEQDKADSRW